MNKEVEFVSIVPLTFFDCQVDKVELDHKLYLRRINDDELRKLIKAALCYQSNLEDALLSHNVEFAIERRTLVNTEDETPEYPEWNEEAPYVRDILATLRLLKSGYLDCPTAFCYSGDESRGVSNTAPRVKYYLGEPYFLEEKEVPTFVELWREFQRIGKRKKYLKFPLNQFMKAYEDDFPEDMMIDYMTAFESIVFGRGGNSPRPIGKTIGIAIGMFLGKNEKERGKIEKDLEEAYTARDKIVHGHLRWKFKADLDLLSRVENYLRRSLRSLVEE